MTGSYVNAFPLRDLPKVRQETMDLLHARGVTLVDLQFSDIAGGMKSLTIPVGRFEKTFLEGYRFDGAAMAGSARLVEVDLYLAPDPDTISFLPQHPQEPKRAQVFCWVVRRGGQPFPGDPRSALQQQLQKAATHGFDYRVGVELEFYLLGKEEPGNPNWRPFTDNLGYFDAGEDMLSRTRHEILEALQGIGIEVGAAHHETGPGQQELDIQPTGSIRIADQLVTIRQTIRAVARRHGLRATFMAKPFPDAPGSGMHFFQRLLSLTDGRDLLHDPDNGNTLSDAARHFIGGQLSHARGMCAILNTTINSYKRLADGHRAPRHATWAHYSQGSLIRVPADISGAETEIELRLPDAMGNPYLGVAVALGAALDGIHNGEEPISPLDENLVKIDDDELYRLGIPRLPATLGEAVEALVTDNIVRIALGDYIHDQLISVKQAEWVDYRKQVSPWEIAHYGDV